MTTRRTTLRRSLRLPLSLGRKLPALTADVSRGGFSAELPQVFLPGSQVDGYFLLDDKELAFRGWVAWVIPGNPMDSVFSQIGVRFNQMPEGLKGVFAKLQKRPRRLMKK